jgi:hypothetical protein
MGCNIIIVGHINYGHPRGRAKLIKYFGQYEKRVPSRKGMVWIEKDRVGEHAISHRRMDD